LKPTLGKKYFGTNKWIHLLSSNKNAKILCRPLGPKNPFHIT